MPFYRFMVHGRDVSAPEGVRGFYTTRHAFASSEEKARKKVLSTLMKEFTSGVSAPLWNSGPPELTIEEAWRIGFHQLRDAPNKGSTFYDER